MTTRQDKTRVSGPQLALEQAHYDVLILDARERQSLVAVRSLGRKGLQVAALESSDRLLAPAFSSRWCHHQSICPSHEGTNAYLANLVQVLDYTRARVLITSSDGTLALLRQHRKLLEQRVQLALAREAALDIVVNKARTLEVAKSLGLSIPVSIIVHTVDEIREALRETKLPAVVKPVESWVDGGERGSRIISRLVTTFDEAQRTTEELTATGNPVLFQQFLSGKRESMHLMYAKGKIYARFAQWAKRTSPPLGGLSVLRQSIPIPTDIGIQAERLIREIDLEGYSEVEFRRSNTGVPCLMEVNPRLSASIELAVRVGVDFPHLLYQWANGEGIDVVQNYRTGYWMRYLGGDIQATIEALRERGRPGVTSPTRTLFDFCSTFFIPVYYDSVDWCDPLPVYAASSEFVHHLLHLVTGRLRSSLIKNWQNF